MGFFIYEIITFIVKSPNKMDGLGAQQALKKLKEQGYNELNTSQSKNIIQIALEVFKEPMFLLLITCGVLYLLLGDNTEGVIMLCWVFVIIFITFYQNQKTEKALEALKKLSSPRALVIRDGQKIKIAGREVVTEDIVILNEGDRIPADGFLLESNNLSVDESMLTGESLPFLKTNKEDSSEKSLVYSGTLIVQGGGVMQVTATGAHTEFGKIGKSIQLIEQDQTNLQKEMKILIRNLFIIGVVLSVVVILAFYFTRGNFIQALLNGLSATMAILPEEFPVVLTVFLAIGSWRLSQQNVLTRKPSAIETLGSATVLCSDKTGTITQNKMEIASLFVKDTLYNKSTFQQDSNSIQDVLKTAFFASQKNTIDPMEKAIGFSYESYPVKDALSYDLVKEYPLSKHLFAMTRVLKSTDSNYLVCCKGAPEAVLALCKFSDSEQSKLLVHVQKMAEAGQRVLGVAKATSSTSNLPETQQAFDFEFIGFIGFEDPIRPEVPQAIKECYAAGIKVIMITGDYPSTAKSIAQQAGMNVSNLILTGSD